MGDFSHFYHKKKHSICYWWQQNEMFPFTISDFSCDKDGTIRHYTNGMNRVQRFSMQAFRFLSEHRFVYVHCDLVVCYAYDYNSTCARSTTCQQRYRRDVDQGSEDESGMYPLSFGPIMHEKESTDKNSEGELCDCLLLS